ncbi:major facilitator superfamily domain-containing protein [Coprinopsis sp. MPI-PUGE-AT-0042]|nr:major facilitator superfamily domain-containing protein [Coprinopsis sp. MPI-PUGE-AT-0042]
MTITPDTEATPLLAQAKEYQDIYNRFSSARKRGIVSMVSVCGLLPLFISGTFIPCMPQIAKDLHTTPATVSLAVSISVLATSIGALLGSSYSSYYGRRPIYLYLLPFSVAGSVGVASAATVPQLMTWRFFQTFGVSSGLAVGLAVYFASWRYIQAIIGIVVTLAFLLMLAFFPETSHPGSTGVEKSNKPQPRWRPVIMSIMSPLWILRSPALLAVGMLTFLTLTSAFVLMIPIAYTIGERYGIKNEVLIGACLIPNGLGSMVGAPIAGRLSDKIVAKWKAKRAIPGALVLAPSAILLSGIVTKYVDGPIGLTLNLFCFFMSGLGIDMVMSPSAAYVVDVMHSRSAESMAAGTAFRAILLSFFIAGILPFIETFGSLAADIFGACCGWLACCLLIFTIRNGDWLRAQVAVGFSTEDDN